MLEESFRVSISSYYNNATIISFFFRHILPAHPFTSPSYPIFNRFTILLKVFISDHAY